MGKIGYTLAECIYRAGNLFLGVLTAVIYGKTEKDPERIAIVRTGNLGDTFCSIPALRAVQARYPRAYFILLTSEKKDGPLHPVEILDRIIVFDTHIFFNLDKLRRPRYLLQFIRKLRAEKIDLLVYLGFSAKLRIIVRDTIFYGISGCKSAVGFVWAKHGFFRFSQRTYKKFDNTVDRLMKLLRPLGIDTNIISWDIPPPFRPIDIGSSGTEPVIAIHPTAKFPVNRWPLERFVWVIKRLQAERAPILVIIGGPEAVKEAEILVEAAGDRMINLCGKTDFIELADVLRRCDLLISPDSGPVHVAGAVGTPVVGIYSARDYPCRWYPYGNIHTIIRKDVPCQVCFLKECSDMRCIKEITVEEVVRACLSILRTGEKKQD